MLLVCHAILAVQVSAMQEQVLAFQAQGKKLPKARPIALCMWHITAMAARISPKRRRPFQEHF